MERQLPDLELKYVGVLGTSPTIISTTTTYVLMLILSNLTTSDHTVTLTTNEAVPALQWPPVVSGSDQIERNYSNAWDFAGGIQAYCDSPNAVKIQIYGRRNYS